MHTTSRLALDIPDGTDAVSAYPVDAAQSLGVLDNAALFLSGPLAAMPAASATASGTIYYADTNTYYISAGNVWNQLARLDGNGHVPLSALSGITSSQLAPSAGIIAAQLATLLTWTSPPAGTFYFASPQTFNNCLHGGVNFILPNAAGNTGAIVGVRAGAGQTATSPVTVAVNTGQGAIYGPGCWGAPSVPLGALGASLLLESDGANWNIISGQQDSGWMPLTLQGTASSQGIYTPSARLLGDRIYLKGNVGTSSGTIGPNVAFARLGSSSQYPGGLSVVVPSVCFNGSVAAADTVYIEGASGGTPGGIFLSSQTLSTTNSVALDSLSFSIS